MNQDINFKQIPVLLKRYRSLIITCAVMALIALTGYQISQITAIQPDAAYVAAKKDQQRNVSLRLNPKTIQQLKALRSSGDTNIPINTGKQNPFEF